MSADTLEANRRASFTVYGALEHLESHRKDALENGRNAWTMAPTAKAVTLCTWDAFVLQTLGDRFLEADYRGNRMTVGFVPPITADQILRFYTPVEGWLNRALQAHSNPDYQLDWPLPAPLPAWSDVEPCPNAHLHGMLDAMRAVRDHTQAALSFLEASKSQGEEQERGCNIIRQVQAATLSRARYADEMMNGNPSRQAHELVEEHVKAAIEGFFLLGQLLAMPELATTLPVANPPQPPSKIPSLSEQRALTALPGSPWWTASELDRRPPTGRALVAPTDAGFEIWCLTSPEARAKFKGDGDAVRAIKTLWRLDSDPRRTLEIQDEIHAALARGDIGYAEDRYGKKLGHFFCAPWGAAYLAKRSVILGGVHIGAMQQFVFNVSCENVHLGAPFERQIMPGNFAPTKRFELGVPEEAPDGGATLRHQR